MTPRSLSKSGLKLSIGFALLTAVLLAVTYARPIDALVPPTLIQLTWVGYCCSTLYVIRRWAKRGAIGLGFGVLALVSSMFAFLMSKSFEVAANTWQVEATGQTLELVTDHVWAEWRKNQSKPKLDGEQARRFRPPLRLTDVRLPASIELLDYCRNTQHASIDVRFAADGAIPTGPHFEIEVGWCAGGDRTCESRRSHTRRFSLCTTIGPDGPLGLSEAPRSPISLFRLEPDLLASFADDDGDHEVSRSELAGLLSLVSAQPERWIDRVEASADGDGDHRILEPELAEWLRDAVWPGRTPAERAVAPRPRAFRPPFAPTPPERLPVKVPPSGPSQKPRRPQKVAPL
ncbi:MAG: hypothetical protein HY791_01990 [Deltaproteobacteria bacterium]|nr:hypothetical protein [Deltaproteobacteria bacterium]